MSDVNKTREIIVKINKLMKRINKKSYNKTSQYMRITAW
jgi:hypothetical protein